MDICVITAKGGNQSIPNKNLIKINGRSMLSYVIDCAKKSKYISKIFVSTEDKLIAEEAIRNGALIINRPKSLATPTANHGETILHAAMEVEKLVKNLQTITILLGNSIIIRPDDIDNTISALYNDLQADSAMTVWQAQDDHPYRAMYINDMKYLSTFGSHVTLNTNRQSYPNVYYYDQGPWTVRIETLRRAYKGEKNGPACWWWMGKHCVPVVRPWVTGKDVHTMLDVAIATAWLNDKMYLI